MSAPSCGCQANVGRSPTTALPKAGTSGYAPAGGGRPDALFASGGFWRSAPANVRATRSNTPAAPTLPTADTTIGVVAVTRRPLLNSKTARLPRATSTRSPSNSRSPTLAGSTAPSAPSSTLTSPRNWEMRAAGDWAEAGPNPANSNARAIAGRRGTRNRSRWVMSAGEARGMDPGRN